MRYRTSKAFKVESLENRICPALTIRNLPGNLIITGVPSSTTTALLVNQVGGAGGHMFQIKDGAATLGTWSVTSNLTIQMPSRAVDVKIDVNGGVIPGNLIVSLGNGFTSATTRTVDIFSTAAGGRIGKNVTLLGGNGRETISIGEDGGALLPVTIGGDLTAIGRAGGGTLGDSLLLHGAVTGTGSEVRGNLTTSNIDNITIGDQNSDGTARVGKNLSVTLVGSNTGMAANIFGIVNGNVNVNAPSSTSSFHQFTIQNQTIAIDSRIDGSLTVNLGQGGAIGNLVSILGATGGGWKYYRWKCKSDLDEWNCRRSVYT